jgi:ABC-type multidrug transport system permease subunit
MVGSALVVFFTLLQLLGTSRRAASLLATMVTFPLLMIGGSFFPFETMPGWMVAIGRLTPNGQAIAQLNPILFREPDPRSLAAAAAAIALPAAVAFALAARRLERFART